MSTQINFNDKINFKQKDSPITLLWDTGSGKTLATHHILNTVYKGLYQSNNDVVVLCPNSIINTGSQGDVWKEFTTINFEKLSRSLKKEEYLKLLKDKIVIIDEVHKICHKNTEIFRTIYEYLKEKAKRIILLTGTIYSTSDKFLLGYYSLAFNKNNEYYLSLNAEDKDVVDFFTTPYELLFKKVNGKYILDKSVVMSLQEDYPNLTYKQISDLYEEKLFNLYGKYLHIRQSDRGGWGEQNICECDYKIKNPKHRELVGKCLYLSTVTQTELKPMLGEVKNVFYPVEYSPNFKLDNDASEKRVSEYDFTFTNQVNKDLKAWLERNNITYPISMRSGTVDKQLTVQNLDVKLESLLAILKDHPKEQFIVWNKYADLKNVIQEYLTNKGFKTEIFATSLKKKAVTVENDFLDGRIQGLIVSPQSASEGKTWTNASVAIYITPCNTPVLHKQSKNRCIRRGMKDKVTVYFLYYKHKFYGYDELNKYKEHERLTRKEVTSDFNKESK